MADIRLTGPKIKVDRVEFVDFPDVDLRGNPQHLEDIIAFQPEGSISLERSEFLLHETTTFNRAAFTQSRQLEKGRTNSQHQVKIMQLVLSNGVQQDMPTLVAVKPYDESVNGQCTYGTAAASIAHEWAAFNYLANITEELQTFHPIGIWKDQAGITSILTMYEHRVMTYDQILWANTRSVRNISQGKIAHAITSCLFSTGYLLGLGLASNDNKPKNIGWNGKTQQFPDQEWSELYDIRSGRLPLSELNRIFVGKDMNLLIKTMLDSGYTPNKVYPKVAEAMVNTRIVEAAIKKYYEGIKAGTKQSGLHVSEALVLAPENIAERFRTSVAMFVQDHPHRRAALSRKVLGTKL